MFWLRTERETSGEHEELFEKVVCCFFTFNRRLRWSGWHSCSIFGISCFQISVRRQGILSDFCASPLLPPPFPQSNSRTVSQIRQQLLSSSPFPIHPVITFGSCGAISIRGAQVFQNICQSSQNVISARSVTWSKFYTEDPPHKLESPEISAALT